MQVEAKGSHHQVISAGSLQSSWTVVGARVNASEGTSKDKATTTPTSCFRYAGHARALVEGGGMWKEHSKISLVLEGECCMISGIHWHWGSLALGHWRCVLQGMAQKDRSSYSDVLRRCTGAVL